MQAYVAVGWKVDEKSKRVVPFGIYCGPDGVAAEKAAAAVRADPRVSLIGLTIQMVYRSSRPMAVTTNPEAVPHAQQVAEGERAAAERRKAYEAEDAKKLAETHPKGEVAEVKAEKPINPDHAARRQAEKAAAEAEAAAAKAKRKAEAEEAAAQAKRDAEIAKAEAIAAAKAETKVPVKPLGAVAPADPAETPSHGERLRAIESGE